MNITPPAAETPLDQGLDRAPERELYWYRNVGTRERPWFDAGQEIVGPNGEALAAPNPVPADIDGDGLLDLISTEAPYSCNAYRIDWPTSPTVNWFRRPNRADPSVLEGARPLTDAAGKPIPAGLQLRLADLRSVGVPDLVVLISDDAGNRLRWYRNRGGNAGTTFMAAEELHGKDFARIDSASQALPVNWFGADSGDLIIHGASDSHCSFALRRTALYRRVADQPGVGRFELVGYLNYRGDLAMVPPDFEDQPYDCYGSCIALYPDTGDLRKRLVMSVAGRLFLFSDLAPDGLTYRKRQPLMIPAERNRCVGWQHVSVNLAEPVQYIRINNDPRGMLCYRDGLLHIVRLEAWSRERNWASLKEGAKVRGMAKRPRVMLMPDNQPSPTQPNFTSFGWYQGPVIVKLARPVLLESIRFLLSDREAMWYTHLRPYYWQGSLQRVGAEQAATWYQYQVEVSPDGVDWISVADRMTTEMIRSCPCLVDWDNDGIVDLVLGVLNARGIFPSEKVYRVYRNAGTNEEPRFESFESLCDEKRVPLKVDASPRQPHDFHCGILVHDFNRDGKLDLVFEGPYKEGLIYCRNVSSDGGKGPCFKKTRRIDLYWRKTCGCFRFCAGDLNGDGITDLILNSAGSVTLYSGVERFYDPAILLP